MTQVNQSDHRLLQEIRLSKLLSFGPNTAPLVLESLNILIGTNSAGKSNLLEALALMRMTPRDIRNVVRKGGGVSEWIWKGTPKGAPATIELVVNNTKGHQPLRHSISFYEFNQGFRLSDEKIENKDPYPGEQRPYFFYKFQEGHPVLSTKASGERKLARETVDPELSILAQRRDPDLYPEITHLAGVYDKVRIYREWTFGRNTVFREPQKADVRNDRLEEDFSNLGLFLNRLQRNPSATTEILDGLQDLYEGVSGINTIVEGGTVQVFFTEGNFSIPATRLSDGTVRYLCLLAILCDPEPPPLVCIEEPELGLHPDVIPKLADRLVAASRRTQLIVTTHSDILIDAMTDRPETVIVCEKPEGQTQMRRLGQQDLSAWLGQYRLGQLWTKGEIGGTRW